MKTFLRQNYIWIIFLVLVSAGSLASELINGRMEMIDLEVYFRAADRLIDGGELYRSAEEDPWEHYVYKYAPPAALFFIPFLPLGLTFSKFLFWALLTFILGAILYILRLLFLKGSDAYSGMSTSLMLGILIIGMHFFRELHLGQVNLLLLGIYIIALLLLCKEKFRGFSALIAFSIFIKPFGLIFIPLLLIMGRFKVLLYFIGFTIIIALLPVVFYADVSEYFKLYISWYQELGIELVSKQDLLSEGNHTIFSILARYTPISYLQLDGISRNIYQLLILLFIGGLILWYYFKRPVPDRAIRLYIILIAMIPLLAFTSYNAFIFTLPLIIYLLFKFKEMKIIFRIIFIISCVFIGGNIYDLVGRDMFNLLCDISVFSWGTIGLLLTIFINWDSFQTEL